jgi:hypothetical protein
MSLLNLEQLKRRLRWKEIAFSRAACQFQGKDSYACRFQVLPGEPDWPTIDLLFDGDLKFLQELQFSHWHAHYDGLDDPRKNLSTALRGVRSLLRGELCLVEELNADSNYRGGSLLRPNELPGTLGKDIRKLRRVFFNRAPVLEEIDSTRYWEGKHFFVTWTEKEKTEKIYRKAGMPAKFFEW